MYVFFLGFPAVFLGTYIKDLVSALMPGLLLKPKYTVDLSLESSSFPEYDFTSFRQDADIILVSGDKPTSEAKSFYAHRTILAAASPFFRDMFTLPQPARPTNESDVDINGVPRIRLTETHVVLSLLLHLVYPFPKPKINAETFPLPLFSELLDAAAKYDLYFPLAFLRSTLISPDAGYITKDPTRVYAVAYRHDLETEAKEAMRWVVKTGVDISSQPLEDEWKYVSAWEYRRLEKWVRETRKRVADTVTTWFRQQVLDRRHLIAPGSDPIWDELAQLPTCMECNGSLYQRRDEPKWWLEFKKRMNEAQGVGMGGTDGMFEMSFLADVVKECGCPRCAGSVMISAQYLHELKAYIDAMISGADMA